ncbi:dual specificity protein phosphatase family protein [Tardiphaga robiniae]|uniref:dual specificity protein phosphatase family protein n=1 Tax=Tardiphaga robiniae TaxID=943830 RepID=UPI001FCCF04D|nr:dual specificity protein phosphatase family protein [Tardiphaga robiniae]
MKSQALLWLKRFGQAVGIVSALAGGWAGYLRLSGNFHPIEEGVIYRSGQLSGLQFADRIEDNGIRSIINLRGDNTGQPWYDAEMKASRAAGVRHVDFPLSAGRELTDDQVRQLTAMLQDLPRPILVHCEAGADRSGVVSALYKLLVAKRPAEEAAGQLSFRYGHFPWLASRTAAMDRTFARVMLQLTAAAP